MKQRNIFVGLLLIAGIVMSVMFLPGSAHAATAENCGQSGGFFGFPTWYKYLEPTFSNGECNISFEFPQDIGLVLAAIIEILLRIATLVAIGFVVFGGIQFIMSQGEPDRLATARSTIINALIGLVIAVVATVVVTFVAGRF